MCSKAKSSKEVRSVRAGGNERGYVYDGGGGGEGVGTCKKNALHVA